MIKNLVNSTIVNYVLTVIGTFLVSKGFITVDLWDVIQGGLQEAIIAAVSGAGLLAVIFAAARGINESKKDKVVIDGKRVEVTKLPPDTRRSLQDIIQGR